MKPNPVPAAKPMEFKDPLKQRVCYYFTAHPDGDWTHFLQNWPRAFQVDKHKFNEVHRAMQLTGAIPMVVGGKAHEILRKEMEKEIRAKLEGESAEQNPAPAEAITTVPSTEPAEPAEEEIPSEENTNPSSNDKEPEMPTIQRRKQTNKELKELVYKAVQKNPSLPYEDMLKIGNIKPADLDKTVFWSMRRRYTTQGLVPRSLNPNSEPKHTNGHSTRLPATTSPGQPAPLFRLSDEPLLQPQILKAVPCDAMSPEVKKALKDYLPSILTQLFGGKPRFKVVEIMEDEAMLEIRRIS